VRRETGKEQVVEVHGDDGGANHIGPDPWVHVRAARAGLAGPGTIEIEFAAGARIRITGAADAAAVTAAVEALADRWR
jgi:hypothetical protein